MKRSATLSIAIIITLFSQAQKCPGIAVESSSYQVPVGDTLVFVAVTKNAPADVTYNWSVSAGTIESGQGTAMIKVSTGELADGMFVTATLEIGGLPPACTNTASSSSEIIPAAQLVVSGTFTNSQELKSAVQKFIAATAMKDPENSGMAFIYLYAGPKTTESSMKIFKEAIAGAFEYNKILPHQYKIADGGKKKLSFYEIYLIREGSPDPKPSGQ